MTVHALINEVANGRHKAYFDKDLRSSLRPWSAAEKEFDPAIALAAPLAGVPEEVPLGARWRRPWLCVAAEDDRRRHLGVASRSACCARGGGSVSRADALRSALERA
jgi:hypothetical protein